MKPSLPYSHILKQVLKDSDMAIGYLNTALEDEDWDLFLLALQNVAQVQGGLSRVARSANLDRVHLYRMFSRHGNPGMRNIFKLLHTLGFRLTLTAPAEGETRHRRPKKLKKAA